MDQSGRPESLLAPLLWRCNAPLSPPQGGLTLAVGLPPQIPAADRFDATSRRTIRAVPAVMAPVGGIVSPSATTVHLPFPSIPVGTSISAFISPQPVSSAVIPMPPVLVEVRTADTASVANLRADTRAVAATRVVDGPANVVDLVALSACMLG